MVGSTSDSVPLKDDRLYNCKHQKTGPKMILWPDSFCVFLPFSSTSGQGFLCSQAVLVVHFGTIVAE